MTPEERERSNDKFAKESIKLYPKTLHGYVTISKDVIKKQNNDAFLTGIVSGIVWTSIAGIIVAIMIL